MGLTFPNAARAGRRLRQERRRHRRPGRARLRARRDRHRHRRAAARQPDSRGCSGCPTTGRWSTGWASTTTAPRWSRRRLAAARTAPTRRTGTWRRSAVLGVNIGKTKVVPEDDRRSATTRRAPGCWRRTPTTSWSTSARPNTPGLRDLQAVEKLEPLLAARAGARPTRPCRTPGAAAGQDRARPRRRRRARRGRPGRRARPRRHHRHQHHDQPRRPGHRPGRGRADRRRRALRRAADGSASLEVLRLLREPRRRPTSPWSRVGGITTVEDARARLDAGATLLQGYTAFVYDGPLWPRRVLRRTRGPGRGGMTDQHRGPVHVTGEVLATQDGRRLPPPDPGRAGRPRAVPARHLRRGLVGRPGDGSARRAHAGSTGSSPTGGYGATIEIVVEPVGPGDPLAGRPRRRAAGSRSPGRWAARSRCPRSRSAACWSGEGYAAAPLFPLAERLRERGCAVTLRRRRRRTRRTCCRRSRPAARPARSRS